MLSCFGGYLRTIVAGDDNQLPPYIAKELDNVASILTWVRKLKGKFAIPIMLLRTQYRMMPSVGQVVSKNFYEGKLLHAKRSDNRPHLFFHNLGGNTTPMGTSRYSREDSKKCIEILESYKGKIPPLTYQVLTFYEGQCRDVKQLRGDIDVCCIDSYQGQEADIIIVLLSVRNCSLSKFMVSRGRICVGISRARMNLHIVGNLGTMVASDIWRDILKGFKKV